MLEPFAEHYATEIFKRLFAGEPLGQAMLAVRLELLQQHYNPLGLAYSLYAASRGDKRPQIITGKSFWYSASI